MPWSFRLVVVFVVASVAITGCGRPPTNLTPEEPTAAEQRKAPPLRDPDFRIGEVQFRHKVEGQALVISANGESIISGGTDGLIREWDVVTGEVRRALTGHEGMIRALALAPGGQTIASGGEDGTLRLWHMATGKELWRIPAHNGRVATLAFAPDGQSIVSGGWDKAVKGDGWSGAIRLWNAVTGKELRTFDAEDHPVKAVVFSPDGRYLAASGLSLCIWDLSGPNLAHSIPACNDDVLCFSPDSRILLGGSASENQPITLWDVATANELPNPAPYRAIIHAVAFSPDGKQFASGGSFGIVAIWDSATGKPLLNLEGHFGKTRAIAYSPDGKLLATAGDDGVIRLFDSSTGKQIRKPAGHQARVSALAVTPYGKMLASGAWDRSVRLWGLPNGKPIRTLTWERHEQWSSTCATVNSISVSKDGKRLASADFDGPARVWDIENGQVLARIELDRQGPGVAVLLGKGNEVFVGGMAETLDVWDVKTGKRLRNFNHTARDHGAVDQLTVSPDEQVFVHKDGLRSLQSGEVVKRLPISLRGHGHFSAFTPDGKTLVAALVDRAGRIQQPLRVIDLATENEMLAFGKGGWVTAITIAPDGNLLAVGYGDGALDLWDIASGEMKERFGTGQLSVRSLVFSTDGRWLFSGGENGIICGWLVR
jgi:WD40 repeat protein